MRAPPKTSTDARQLAHRALSVTEHRGLAGLDRLESDWRRLYAEMPLRTGFHAYEFHRAYVLYFVPEPDKLRCLTVVADGVVTAICPLEVDPTATRLLGLPVNVWRVTEPLNYPSGDVICARDDVCRSLIPVLTRHLRRDAEGGRLLVLGPAPEDSTLWDGLADLTTLTYCTTFTTAHVFNCSRPFEQLMADLPRKYTSDLRRRRRRLDSLADIEFVTVTGKAKLTTELETFFDLEASGWKGVPGSGGAIGLREPQPDVYRDLFTRMDGEDDRCEINVLYAEGHAIASLLCMRTGCEYSILKTAYDEGYSRLAPGLLLLQYTLEGCCNDPRITRVNMVSHPAWLVPWRPDTVVMKQAYVALGRWSGPPLIALLRLRFGYALRVARWLRTKRDARKRHRLRSPHPARE